MAISLDSYLDKGWTVGRIARHLNRPEEDIMKELDRLGSRPAKKIGRYIQPDNHAKLQTASSEEIARAFRKWGRGYVSV